MALPARIRFITPQLEQEFLKLQKGTDAERRLFKTLVGALLRIEKDAFAGTQVAKRLIPHTYGEYRIDNLWKYNLPGGWRLIYTVSSEDVIILAVVLEWLDHKQYEQRFGY